MGWVLSNKENMFKINRAPQTRGAKIILLKLMEKKYNETKDNKILEAINKLKQNL